VVDHAGLEPPNSRRPGDYRVQHVDGIMAHHQVWGAKVNLQARVGTFALLQALGGGPGQNRAATHFAPVLQTGFLAPRTFADDLGCGTGPKCVSGVASKLDGESSAARRP
jgi:hypothetical protein